jgi:DHA1 family multidrug resistance protein-like MFS transporter
MFDNLGIEWAGTLLGCLALVCVPIPVCFYFYGKKLRQKSKFAPTMQIKKPTDEESTSDEDGEHDTNMAALHATRSRAHHDLEVRSRRSRTNGDLTNTPSAAAGDPEKKS